jgi:hypothetical protein
MARLDLPTRPSLRQQRRGFLMDSIQSCRSFSLSAIAGICVVLAAPASAQTSILPSGEPIGGVDQATLSQQWWNWALSYSPAVNPLLDTTGVFASLGDQGSHFFLAGAVFTTDPIVRNVTVRNDQTLFLPLINTFAGYTDEQMAEAGLTLSDIRTETTNFMGNVSGLYLRLDGSALPLADGSPSLLAFRQPTGVFDLAVPSDNIFGAPAGTYRSFSDGYWVGLAPFQNGVYELRFGGSNEGTGPATGQNFSQDITYRINVVPEPAAVAMMLLGLALVAGLARNRQSA